MPISNVSGNLRAGICTSTTRPTSPYAGQQIYETDTNLGYIWNGSSWVRIYPEPVTTKGDIATYSTAPDRLAVGANNKYLVANSSTSTGLQWSTNPAGMDLIAEQSFSGSVLTIDNCFSSAYQNYRIMAYGEHTGTAGGVTMWMQLKNGSGISAQGYYSLTTYNTNSAGPTRDWQAYIPNGFWAGTFANLYGAISLDLFNPHISGWTYFNAQSAGWGTSTGFQVVNSGFQYVSNSYTGLYIYPNSGTTVNGTVRVYGYRNL